MKRCQNNPSFFRYAKAAWVFAFVYDVSACTKGPAVLSQSGESSPFSKRSTMESVTNKDQNGDITGKIGSSSISQTLTAADSSDVFGTAVTFPPGALAIGTEITIATSTNIVTSDLSVDLGLEPSNEIKAAAPAVAIFAAGTTSSANEPFTLAIPLPESTGLSLADIYDRLVIIYRVQTDNASETRTGILPRSELKINGKSIEFSSKYFGAFQAAFSTIVIETKKEVASTAVILTKTAEAKLEPIVMNMGAVDGLTPRSAVFSLAVTGLGELDRCIVTVDGDKSSPWDQWKSLGAVTSYTVIASSDSAQKVFARFSCRGKSGRDTGNSAWAEYSFADATKVIEPSAVPTSIPSPTPTANPPFTASFQAPAANSYINNANAAAFAISGPCSEVAATIVISNDGDNAAVASTTCTPSLNWSATLDLQRFSDGTVTLNLSSPLSPSTTDQRHFIKDTSAPTLALSFPSALNATTNVSGTVSNAQTISWEKISGPGSIAFGTPTSATTSVTASADGSYVIRSTAVDEAGNSANMTLSFVWSSLSPTASLSGAPTGTAISPGYTVIVGGSNVVSYKYKIGQSSGIDCGNASGYSVSTAVALPIAGSITAGNDDWIKLCVVASDSLGNWQSYSAASTASWIFDLTPPTLSSGLLTASTIGLNSITVNWAHASDAVSTSSALQYLLVRSNADNISTLSDAFANGTLVGTWTPNTSTSVATGLSGATTYYFNVIAKDESNNKIAYTSQPFSTSSDATPPEPGNSGIVAANTITDSSLVLVWTKASDNVTADSSLKYQVFMSTANDITDVTSAESKTAINGSPTLDIDTLSPSGLSSGTDYYFGIVVQDLVGNKALYNVLLITTSPIVTLTGAPSGLVFTSSYNITVGGSHVVNYKFKIGQSATTNCTSATGYSASTSIATNIAGTISGGSDGLQKLCVLGSTANGAWQLQTSPTTAMWTYDATVPSPGNSGNLSTSAVSSNSVTLNWQKGTDSVSPQGNLKYQVFYDTANISSVGTAEATTAANSPTFDIATLSVSGLAMSTNYYFAVVIRDESGNKALYNVINQATTGDTTAPTPGSSGSLTGSKTFTSVTLNWTAATDNVTAPINLVYLIYYGTVTDPYSNGALYNTSTNITTATIIGLNQNTHYYFAVHVQDSVGNLGIYNPYDVTTTADTTNPVVNVGSNILTNTSVSIPGSVTDDTSTTVAWTKDSGPGSITFSSASAPTTTVTASLDGVYQLRLTATDSAGNTAYSTLSFTWDTTAPNALTTFNAMPGLGIGDIDLQLGFADLNPDLITIREATGATPPASCAAGSIIYSSDNHTDGIRTFSERTPGTSYSYRVCVADPAGNQISSNTGTTSAPGNRMFVTSMSFDGDLMSTYDSLNFTDGLNGADYRCQHLATSASLPGYWRAFLSDANNPANSRINFEAAPILNLNGSSLASNKTDLFDGSLAVPLANDETKATLTGGPSAWTGTATNGLSGVSSCNNWSSNSSGGYGQSGYSSSTSSTWLNTCNNASGCYCSIGLRLYCISQKVPGLVGFWGKPGSGSVGTIDLEITFPAAATTLYKKVEVRALAGAVPNIACTNSDSSAVVKTFLDTDSPKFDQTAFTISAGAAKGFRACIYDQTNQLVTSHAAHFLIPPSTAAYTCNSTGGVWTNAGGGCKLTDTGINLVFSERSGSTSPSGAKNWTNASNYCLSKADGGFMNWRLPTSAELGFLYTRAATNVWTTTTNYNSTDQAWTSEVYTPGHYIRSLEGDTLSSVSDTAYQTVVCVRTP